MATRRAFFGVALAPAVAATAIIVGGSPSVIRNRMWSRGPRGELVGGDLLSGAEVYHPYGYVQGGDAICDHILAVLLDGEALSREIVVAADDRAGWVLVIERNHGPTRRRTGVVRYAWSEEALT